MTYARDVNPSWPTVCPFFEKETKEYKTWKKHDTQKCWQKCLMFLFYFCHIHLSVIFFISSKNPVPNFCTSMYSKLLIFLSHLWGPSFIISHRCAWNPYSLSHEAKNCRQLFNHQSHPPLKWLLLYSCTGPTWICSTLQGRLSISIGTGTTALAGWRTERRRM